MQITEEQVDINMNDKGTGDPFNKPIAGQSLVNEPGNIPSEKQPDYVDPEEVYAKCIFFSRYKSSYKYLKTYFKKVFG